MRSRLLLAVFLIVCASFTPLTTAAQESATAPAAAAASHVVPSLINYTGVLKDATGRTLTNLTGVTFLLYSSEQGGAPLWLETQNVAPDKAGRYAVQLGAASKDGIPPNLFMNGEARWLALQIGSEAEQPRVLLVAVPYAMKSVDAQTLGGLPPSAFVLAAPPTSAASPAAASAISAAPSSSSAAVPPPAVAVTTSGAAANVKTIALFSTATDIEKSIISQTGTTAINVAGSLNLPAIGTATTLKGFNSQPERYTASVFNSSTSTAVPQNFVLQAEPLNNNTTTATGTLNLLYASGAATPTETGFKINNKGLLTFAAGQTFPGTGTVTSVTAGAGLAGGTITKTGTISIAAGGVSNADLAHSSLTVTAGADLTGGGLVALGGATTLNLDTTKVPLLAAANTFTAVNTFNNNMTVNGTVTANALSTSGINSFSPGFSDFSGTFGSWEVLVENNGGGNGIISQNNASSGTNSGVYGVSTSSPTGNGIFGQQGNFSGGGSVFSSFGRGAGVWGDGGTTSAGTGIVGTTDNGNAGTFINNTTAWDTVFIDARQATFPLVVENNPNGTFCDIDGSANLFCSGSITAAVNLTGGARTVGLSAIQSPKNWFEDFGSAELVHGSAVVRLDADFMETVNTAREYQVFLTPYGDCKGLYVSRRTPNSFEVHELSGGTANLSFGYRITALRLKYEDVRFVDQTRNVEHVKLMGKSRVAPHSQTPDMNLQRRPASTQAMLMPTATKSKTH